MRIILGIAKGLKYLHLELQPPFTISDLNSSAVYLTDDFSPMVTCFMSNLPIFLFHFDVFTYELVVAVNLFSFE